MASNYYVLTLYCPDCDDTQTVTVPASDLSKEWHRAIPLHCGQCERRMNITFNGRAKRKAY